MQRRESTRFVKYWTESGPGDGQGHVAKKDHQLYRRPYMIGKARGKEEEEDNQICRQNYPTLFCMTLTLYHQGHCGTPWLVINNVHLEHRIAKIF